jgi:hypothetical protein
MGDDRVAQTGVGHARQHRGLDHGYDLAGLGAKHGEAENAIANLPRGAIFHFTVPTHPGSAS